MVSKTLTPLSNFIYSMLLKIEYKTFQRCLTRDQLPQRSNGKETGIINLDNKDGPGTHWVAYAIDPRGIIYFDSYGLAPPVEFFRCDSGLSKGSSGKQGFLWQSTLPTQTLTAPPIRGQEVLNVLDGISRNPKIPPHKIVHKYTASQYENRNNV